MESFVLPLALIQLGYCSGIVDEKAVREAVMKSELETLIGLQSTSEAKNVSIIATNIKECKLKTTLGELNICIGI